MTVLILIFSIQAPAESWVGNQSKPLPKCNLNFITNSCKIFQPGQSFSEYDFVSNRSIPNLGELQSGTVLTESMNRPVTTSEVQNADKVFEKIKSAAISSILKNRNKNDPNVSEYERNLITRIETLKVIPAPSNSEKCHPKICDSTGAVVTDLSRPSPNASYFNEQHRIAMCPMLYKTSPIYMMMILSHELGHSIDPCNSTKSLYELNNRSGLQSQNGYNLAASKLQPGQRYLMAQPSYVSEKLLEGYEPQYISRLASPIPAPEYPYKTVRSCFVRNGGSITQEQAEAEAKSQKSIIDSNPNLFKISVPSQVNLENRVKMHQTCVTGVAREDFADWFASGTMAEYLKNFSTMPVRLRYQVGSVLAGFICSNKAVAASSHSSNAERLNNFLKNPDLQKVLGCRGVDEPSSSCGYNDDGTRENTIQYDENNISQPGQITH